MCQKSEIRQLNVTRCKMLNEEALRVLETLDGWVQLLPLHISRLFSCTFENVRSQTFQSIKPFKQFSGSHWGRSSLKPRSKERVWRARKVPLFTHNLVSWTHYLVTFPCNFYLISFIMYILSCILLIGFILYLAHKFYLISCTSSFILYLAQSGEQTDGWNRGAAESHCSPCRGSTACLKNVKQIKCSNWSINGEMLKLVKLDSDFGNNV